MSDNAAAATISAPQGSVSQGWMGSLRGAQWGRAWAEGDFPYLSNLKVGTRGNLLLGVALLSALVFGLVSYGGEHQISQAMAERTSFARMGELASDMRADMLAMQVAEEDFLRTHDMAAVAQYRALTARMTENLSRLNQLPTSKPVADDIAALGDQMTALGHEFEDVLHSEQVMGLDDASGLRGALAHSVKDIEDELKVWPNQDALMSKMLGMRQAEKDFMLYGSSDYLGKHRKYSMEFDLKIDSAGLPASTAENFRTLLAKYMSDMSDFADGSESVKAQIETMRGDVEAMKPQMERLFQYSRDGAARATDYQEHTRQSILRNNLLTAVMALLTFFGLSLVLSRSIVSPLRLIEQVMERLVSGETHVAVPGIRRKDEIGDMARAVDVFKTNALAMVELQKDHQNLMRLAEDERKAAMLALADQFEATVKTVVEDVSKSSLIIADTAKNVAHHNGEYGESRSLQVTEAAEKAQRSVKEALVAAEELGVSIHHVERLIRDTEEVVRSGAAELSDADRRVAALAKAAEEIGAVVGLISQIAHQTNMLALNATIESVRAGEAGQGFAVVAREVKTLADQTAEATGRIASQIGAIQQAAKDTTQTIESIGGTIRRVSEITDAVDDAMRRQENATDQIVTCVQTLSVDSATVVEGVIEVSRSSANYCGSAIRVLWDANDLARPAKLLKAEVDAFLARIRG